MTNLNINIDGIDNASEIVPAKDRVSLEFLETVLEQNGRERVVDMDLIDSYRTDARYGERWHMQKAICLVIEDHAGTLTVVELAYVIDQWFHKANYGIGRARVDVRKVMNKKFKCQHPTAIKNAVELA